MATSAKKMTKDLKPKGPTENKKMSKMAKKEKPKVQGPKRVTPGAKKRKNGPKPISDLAKQSVVRRGY